MISFIFRVKKIPLPWQLASGLTMKVFALPLTNWFLKSPISAGSSQVYGKNLYSWGNYFLIFIRFLPKWFFLAREYIPGKWLIFWCAKKFRIWYVAFCPRFQVKLLHQSKTYPNCWNLLHITESIWIVSCQQIWQHHTLYLFLCIFLPETFIIKVLFVISSSSLSLSLNSPLKKGSSFFDLFYFCYIKYFIITVIIIFLFISNDYMLLKLFLLSYKRPNELNSNPTFCFHNMVSMEYKQLQIH